ncbi:MAG: hypothetical protein ACREEP_03950, partial [Dongiaceae bacterium]
MNVDEIVSWFGEKRTPRLAESDVITLLSSAHPRIVFLKTLPFGTELLDLGADGGLEVHRRWPAPERTDLRIYAYASSKGAKFDAYDGFEVGTWDTAPPDFGGRSFGAVVSSHFIDKIKDPGPLIEWLARRVAPGGRVYLEWPSPFAILLPPNREFAARGIGLM